MCTPVLDILRIINIYIYILDLYIFEDPGAVLYPYSIGLRKKHESLVLHDKDQHFEKPTLRPQKFVPTLKPKTLPALGPRIGKDPTPRQCLHLSRHPKKIS